ncbi:MAG: ATPase [Thermotogaceae bacterium]|nr:ATPase [Thermotogaceae bacterium]
MKVLGIDGGGTTTKAILIDDEKTYKKILKEGMNLTSISDEKLIDILQKIKNWSGKVDGIGASLSGGGREFQIKRFKKVAEDIFGKVVLYAISDAEAVVRFCVTEENGIVAIAGTGSIVLSKSGKRKGGWGFLFDDEGGGFSISLKLIKKAFDYFDGVENYDETFDIILKHFKVKEVPDLIPIQSQRNFKETISSLTKSLKPTPLVLSVIKEEIERFAKRIKKLADEEKVEIVYTFGGMFNMEIYKEIFENSIKPLKSKPCNIDVSYELAKYMMEEMI